MFKSITRFIKQNSLTLALFSIFLVCILGLSLFGLAHENEERTLHYLKAYSYGEYITSGSFIEAVFENWESEFLQMAALVILTIFLYQRGSEDSKKLRGKEKVETMSRYSIIRAATFGKRIRAVGHVLYRNSLSIALLLLFAGSFMLHALGGVETYNQEVFTHGGGEYLTVWQYLTTSQFWFESFQNWQSEFLAVGVLLLLSIFLRQQGSPESKPVGASYSQTGS